MKHLYDKSPFDAMINKKIKVDFMKGKTFVGTLKSVSKENDLFIENEETGATLFINATQAAITLVKE